MNPIIHELICDEPWFSLIRQGVKPVEGRKNSPKYQKIQPRDLINFLHAKESFLARVLEVRRYPSLEAYLEDVTFQKALPNVSSLAAAVAIYHRWHTPEEIQKGMVFWGYSSRLYEWARGPYAAELVPDLAP